MATGSSINRVDLMRQRAERIGLRLQVEKLKNRKFRYLFSEGRIPSHPRPFTSVSKAEVFLAAHETSRSKASRRRNQKLSDNIRQWNVEMLRELADKVEAGLGEVLTRESHHESVPFTDEFFNRVGTTLHVLLVRVPDLKGDISVKNEKPKSYR